VNKTYRVLKEYRVTGGIVSGSVDDPKKIFKIDLDLHDSSLILVHNYASGSIQPGEADQKITKMIKECGILMDIAVLDHKIIGDDRYYSLANEGGM
jgi:DNA repair protein RadC